MTDLRRTVPFIGLAALAWIVASAWDPVHHQHLTDIPVYEDAAGRMADGQLPYRDFDFEYPPLAAVLQFAVRLCWGASGFSLVMFLALVMTLSCSPRRMRCVSCASANDRRVVGPHASPARTWCRRLTSPSLRLAGRAAAVIDWFSRCGCSPPPSP